MELEDRLFCRLVMAKEQEAENRNKWTIFTQIEFSHYFPHYLKTVFTLKVPQGPILEPLLFKLLNK